MKHLKLFIIFFCLAIGISAQPISFTNGASSPITNGVTLTTILNGLNAHAVDFINTTTSSINISQISFNLLVSPSYNGNIPITINLYSIPLAATVAYANMTLIGSTTINPNFAGPGSGSFQGNYDIHNVIEAINLQIPANTARFIVEITSSFIGAVSFVAGNTTNPTTYWFSSAFGFILGPVNRAGPINGIYLTVSGELAVVTPALGEWGLILLILFLMLIGQIFILQSKHAFAHVTSQASLNANSYLLSYFRQQLLEYKFTLLKYAIIIFTLLVLTLFFMVNVFSYSITPYDLPGIALATMLLAIMYLFKVRHPGK